MRTAALSFSKLVLNFTQAVTFGRWRAAFRAAHKLQQHSQPPHFFTSHSVTRHHPLPVLTRTHGSEVGHYCGGKLGGLEPAEKIKSENWFGLPFFIALTDA